MKYDDASWHYGGVFPNDLPDEAGATHAGMFLAWGLLSGLAGDVHVNELREGLEALRSRTITPGAFLMKYCDGKVTDEDLNDKGNAFASAYFDFDLGRYVDDYEDLLVGDLPSFYHVPDTWESFDKLKPVLDARLAEWSANEG